jgi:hypothetical protein
MYMRPVGSESNDDAFLRAVETYFNDVVFFEPALLAMYERILPEVGQALGESAASRSPGP